MGPTELISRGLAPLALMLGSIVSASLLFHATKTRQLTENCAGSPSLRSNPSWALPQVQSRGARAAEAPAAAFLTFLPPDDRALPDSFSLLSGPLPRR